MMPNLEVREGRQERLFPFNLTVSGCVAVCVSAQTFSGRVRCRQVQGDIPSAAFWSRPHRSAESGVALRLVLLVWMRQSWSPTCASWAQPPLWREAHYTPNADTSDGPTFMGDRH